MVEKIKGFLQKYRLVTLLLLIVIGAALPLIIRANYVRGVICRIAMYITLAGSLNAINGYSGQFSLGHAGFLCIGAYTQALLTTKAGFSFWLALPFAAIMALIVGLIVALPTSKLKGIYLSFVTIGFSEIIRLIALNWTDFTGGSLGIKNIPRPVLFGISFKSTASFYYLFFIVGIIFLFITNRILNSRVGRAWLSIREGEAAARSLGVNAARYKAWNFAYGAFWAGLTGGLYASYMKYIDSSLFTLDKGFEILSMVVIGGMGTLSGPVLGSIIVTLLTEALRFAGYFRMVVYALLIIGIMWWRPQGLFGASDSVLAGEKESKQAIKIKRKVEKE